MGQAFKVSQQQRPALLVGQISQRLPHGSALFRAQRIGRRIANIFARQLRGLVGQSSPRSGRAQTVEGAAAGDGYQPGKGAPARFIKVIRPPPNLQKSFLQNVLRLGAVMQYTHDEAE